MNKTRTIWQGFAALSILVAVAFTLTTAAFKGGSFACLNRSGRAEPEQRAAGS
jgi:hypothetical protein